MPSVTTKIIPIKPTIEALSFLRQNVSFKKSGAKNIAKIGCVFANKELFELVEKKRPKNRRSEKAERQNTPMKIICMTSFFSIRLLKVFISIIKKGLIISAP